MLIEKERLIQAHMRRYHKGSGAFDESDSDDYNVDEELVEPHSGNEPTSNASNNPYVLLFAVQKCCLTGRITGKGHPSHNKQTHLSNLRLALRVSPCMFPTPMLVAPLIHCYCPVLRFDDPHYRISGLIPAQNQCHADVGRVNLQPLLPHRRHAEVAHLLQTIMMWPWTLERYRRCNNEFVRPRDLERIKRCADTHSNFPLTQPFQFGAFKDQATQAELPNVSIHSHSQCQDSAPYLAC